MTLGNCLYSHFDSLRNFPTYRFLENAICKILFSEKNRTLNFQALTLSQQLHQPELQQTKWTCHNKWSSASEAGMFPTNWKSDSLWRDATVTKSGATSPLHSHVDYNGWILPIQSSSGLETYGPGSVLGWVVQVYQLSSAYNNITSGQINTLKFKPLFFQISLLFYTFYLESNLQMCFMHS